MGKIYVVNCTGQFTDLHYRTAFAIDPNGNRMDGRNLAPIVKHMRPGEQVELGKDFSVNEITAVIEELEKFGAAPVEDVRTAKAKGFVRFVYSLDKPVPRPVCVDVKEHNLGFLTVKGDELRKRAAIASDHNIRRTIADITGQEDAGPKVEIEFSAAETLDEKASGFEQGFRIEPAPRGRGRPRKAG